MARLSRRFGVRGEVREKGGGDKRESGGGGG
jgi:hypothetical protein